MQRRRLLWSAERDEEREELAWLSSIECGGKEWCKRLAFSFLLICVPQLTYEVRWGPTREFICLTVVDRLACDNSVIKSDCR